MTQKKILAGFLVIFFISVSSILFYKITKKDNNKNIEVSIFAGSGKIGSTDSTNLNSSFNLPYSITLDKDGSILVVDSYNNKIRRIKNGSIITVAGYSDKKDSFGLPMGEYRDGEISSAKFNKPRDTVVDSKGNIYISDTGNNVIRKISNWNVFTYAGSSQKGYIDGKASEAKFNMPSGLAIDKNDNIYVADTLNNVIRKITTKGEVTTIAGKFNEKGGFINGKSSNALFNEPEDVALDGKGTLFVLDSGNQLIRKVENELVTTFSGCTSDFMPGTNYYEGGYKDGPATSAKFNFPKGFFLTEEGILIVADTWNNKIRLIKPNGSVITLAGSDSAGNKLSSKIKTEFNGPSSVLYNKGILYICDMRNNYIDMFSINLKDFINK